MALESVFAKHIADSSGKFEPQRSNMAVLRLTPPSGLTGNPTDLVLALSTFPLPKINNEALEIPYGNDRSKFAGPATFDEMSVVYRDYCVPDLAGILYAWRLLVYDPETGRVGLAQNYKGQGTIEKTGPDGESFPRFWKCQGVWPSGMDAGDADLSSGEPVQITMTFQIDRAVYTSR